MKKKVIMIICCCLVLCQFSCTPRQEKPNPADIRIVAGDKYGCDLVCWFDEIGICYDLEQEIDPEECYVTIWGTESEEYNYYLIYLHYGYNGSKNFFLGDLRYVEDGALFGGRYELDPLHSDFNTGNLLIPKANRTAEAHPMEQESGGFFACTNLWTDLWGTHPAEQHETWTDTMGTIRAYDAEKHMIGITEGLDLEYNQSYDIPEGPIGDDLTALHVPEDAMLCMYFDLGAGLVTRDYFFKLLEWNYIGFEPGGRLLFDGDVLLGYSEIMYPCLD